MEDESRRIMRPVVFDQGEEDQNAGKRFKTVPLPGEHNTAVLWAGSEVGTIGAALAHKFLTKHGTRLRDPMLLTDIQYCELYAKVRMDLLKYRQMKGSFVQRKLLGAQVRNVPNNFRDTE
jgi:hypothetical protein